MFPMNSTVGSVVEPPIAEAKAWARSWSGTGDNRLLDLAQAVPSYPPAQSLREHLAARTSLFETAQYTPITGIAPLREALSQHTCEVYGTSFVTGANVLITAGCNQAFCLSLMALARAGDEVILPLPYYFNHQMWLDATGVSAKHLPFREDRAGVPDPQDAAALITPRTRAIVLVSPNNPTGAVIPPETLSAFRDLAASNNIALVVDETYKDFMEPGAQRHSLFSDGHWGNTVIQLYSFSKSFSLTGYRAGSIIAGTAFIEQVAKLMDCVSICTSRIAQEGALYALHNLWPWANEKATLIAERRKALADAMAGSNSGFEIISTGAYFAYVRHPFKDETAAEVAKRLAKDHGVLCLPGSVFGSEQEAYLRLAVANLEANDVANLTQRLA